MDIEVSNLSLESYGVDLHKRREAIYKDTLITYQIQLVKLQCPLKRTIFAGR